MGRRGQNPEVNRREKHFVVFFKYLINNRRAHMQVSMRGREAKKKDRDTLGGRDTRFEIMASIGLILIITFIAFYPSLLNGFTNWDDDIYVTDNTLIHHVSWSHFKKIITSFYFNLYNPPVLLSYALEYHFFKLNPLPYHATNLALHLLNCLLVLWMVFMLSRNLYSACIAALLFGVHPLRVQSVAWIAERKDLLYSFFFLLSLVSYIYYREKAAMKYYYLALGLFVLSLLSKPMGVTLPFILLLYDVMYHKRLDRSILFEKIPFFACALAIAAATIPYQVQKSHSLAIMHNAFIASYAILSYISKILVPVNLTFFHYYPESLKEHIPPLFLFFPFLVLALVAGLVMAKRNSSTITFGGFFFLITLFPVIQLLPIAGHELTAERYTYIPSIGIIYIFSEAFVGLYSRIGTRWRVAFVLALGLIIGIFSLMTWERSKVWKDSITFWNNVLAYDPNIPVANNNLGEVYGQRGEHDRAYAYFDRALALDPTLQRVYLNRGTANTRKGHYDRALLDFNKAIALDPSSGESYLGRGDCYFNEGDLDRALSDYMQAARLNPEMAKVYLNRGNLFAKRGDYDKALADYGSALSLDPTMVEAYFGHGGLLFRRGEFSRAIADFNDVLRLRPTYFNAYQLRAMAYLMIGGYDKAMDDVRALRARGQEPAPELIRRLEEHYGGEHR
jgi:protein O-mannosyl-transferase